MTQSANTKRLAEIYQRILGDTRHVEGAGELNPSWLSGKGKIGVVGEVSTSGWASRRLWTICVASCPKVHERTGGSRDLSFLG
ncbi:MAG: hypothetical protein ACE5I8_03955 [Thermodesulfobacteriota bacterium]